MTCIRSTLLRAAAETALFWVGAVLTTLFLLTGVLAAQEGVGAPPLDPPPPAVQQGGALAAVLPDQIKVRCFASDLSPAYEDVLQKGAAVPTGRVEGGYRQVFLPLGPVGYVAKKFATQPEAGVVKAIGRVSFRYRPQTGEAPVANLGDGAELHVVGEHEDWWRVRYSQAESWVPAAEVQVFEQPPDTMKLAWTELEKVHRGEVDAWLQQVAAAAAAAQKEQADRQKLAALGDRLRSEMDKPVAEQQYGPLEQDLAALVQSLPEQSPLRADADALGKRIADRKWVAEATAVRGTVIPPPADLPVVAPQVRDPLERFDATGWLRYNSLLGRPGYFTIEKGKQVLYHVTCNSRRYDLMLFVDKEVGLIGPRKRPGSESMRVLDVEKLEVLGVPPRL